MAKVNEALPNLPLPPQPSFVSRSGGPDALQITVRSPASPEAVAAYYRAVFKTGQWKLVNDAKDADGATVLLAQRNGPPLWVRIQPRERRGLDGRAVGGGGEQDRQRGSEAGVLRHDVPVLR